MWSSSTSEVVNTASGFSPKIERDRGTYVTTSDHSSGLGDKEDKSIVLHDWEK